MTKNNSPALTSNGIPIWQQPEIVNWIQIVNQSYYRLFDQNLIEPVGTPEQLSDRLFHAPFVLVSHGTQAEPIFNYGNQTALRLWSMNWSEFTQMPSAVSAEPVAREERARMLEQAKRQGYIENCQGVRISSQGKRFMIKQVTIWNLTDELSRKCGQAATYPSWEWL